MKDEARWEEGHAGRSLEGAVSVGDERQKDVVDCCSGIPFPSESPLTGRPANPTECEDWHVPVALVDLNALKDDNWDITAARVSQYINGVNHVLRIAELADADPALTRETLKHMLFYQVIMMVSSICSPQLVLRYKSGQVLDPTNPESCELSDI